MARDLVRRGETSVRVHPRAASRIGSRPPSERAHGSHPTGQVTGGWLARLDAGSHWRRHPTCLLDDVGGIPFVCTACCGGVPHLGHTTPWRRLRFSWRDVYSSHRSAMVSRAAVARPSNCSECSAARVVRSVAAVARSAAASAAFAPARHQRSHRGWLRGLRRPARRRRARWQG